MPSKKSRFKSLKIIGIVIGVIYFVSGLLLLRDYTRDQEPVPIFRGWLLYSDGPYKGKVLDTETGKPIEGAVVAGSWYLEVFPGWPKFCDAVETTTDKDGEFILPRAWCINLWPIAQLSLPGEVIVFKPGYLGYPPLGPSPEERKARMPNFTGQEFLDKKQYKVIELGRPKTREEKIATLHEAEDVLNFFNGYKKLPMLLESADKENKALGFGEIPYKKRGRK